LGRNPDFDLSDKPNHVNERKQRKNKSRNTESKALFGHPTIIPKMSADFIKNPMEGDMFAGRPQSR
jgi:hypothetical protein